MWEKGEAQHGETGSRRKENYGEFCGGGEADQLLTGESETVGREEVEDACDGEN